MKPAASYARLSNTKDPNEPTIEYQHKKNVEYLTELGYTVSDADLLAEPKGHRSGRHLSQRPTMRQLIELLPKYKAVAFFDFTRFARNFRFAFDFIERAASLKVKIYNTSNRREITVRNASEYIETGIQAMFAEYESIQGTDRMTNAYKRARENGWNYHRRAPLGLKVTGSKADRRFEPASDMRTVIAFLKLAAEGKSIDEAAQELRKKNYQARTWNGEPVPIQPYHLRKVARHLNIYEFFVEPALFASASRRLAERMGHKLNGRKVKHVTGILRWVLVCAECGRRWKLSCQRNHGGWFLAYRHEQMYLCPNRHKVARHKLDAQVLRVMDRLAERISQDSSFVHTVFQSQMNKSEPETDQKRQVLEKRLRNLRKLIADSDMTDDDLADFKLQKADIEQELASLPIEATSNQPLRLNESEIELLIASSVTWRHMAKSKPEEFNQLLRDLFEKITVNELNQLRFFPRGEIADLFQGILDSQGNVLDVTL